MSFIAKTFGGLSKSYYIRQFLFGLIFFSFVVFIGYDLYSRSGNISGLVVFSLYGLICLLLYPYSRFVYESVMDYIFGNNVFFVNAIFLLSVKLTTMALCFFFSIIIAPIGLAYLYFYHSKQKNTN